MKIAHNPDSVVPKHTQSMKVSTAVCHTTKDHAYRVEYTFGTGDGTMATVSPDEARDLIAALSDKLVELAAVDGDAYRLGQEWNRSRQ